MESAAKSDAVNGTPGKVVKPVSVVLDESGPSVERNGDHGETIEDIISELNATAKKEEPEKDEPLVEVLTLDSLESDEQPNLDSSDQWDRKTESVASSPGSVGEVATHGEEKASMVLTDAPVGGEGEVPVPLTDEVPSEDAEKPAEASNGGTAELESQASPECSGATDAVAEPKLADELTEKKPEETKPNLEDVDAGSEEATTSTCDIKAPDEALQSPRRTSRQRTISVKLAESNTSSPNRARRRGSEASGASSAESSPVKPGAKQCLTSDSESDAPLAQRRKMLRSEDQPTVAAKTKRLTSDSESDTPLAQKKPKTTSTEGRPTAAVKAKKLTSDSESDSPVAKRRKVPTRRPSSTVEVSERSQVKRATRVQSAEPPSKRMLIKRSAKQSKETGETTKDNEGQDTQGSEHSCATDTEAVNKKKTPSLAGKTKRKATEQELPANSCDSTPAKQSLNEDHGKPDGASELTKENMSMLESALTTGSAPSVVVNKKTKKAPKGKELNKQDIVKEDVVDGLNVSNISTNGGSCAVESREPVSKQTSSAETVEKASSWSVCQFTESDRLLQESISLSLKNRVPVSNRSYLMVEVPSGNARRMWGPASKCRRPTIVFGGCDPLNTYVNIKGVRVPLRQWQHVSRITPTVRLTDIFRCLPSA